MKTTPGQPCPECAELTPDLPLCYGAEAPWRLLGVAESEFESRVELTADQCVIDEKDFFIRGHIILPIVGSQDAFEWSVWCSLSEKSFRHMCQRWSDPDRALDPPYFGRLTTELPCYPEKLHLKTSVQSRAIGLVPSVTLEPTNHPLAIEQREGVTLSRIREFAHQILHVSSGDRPAEAGSNDWR